MSVIENLNKSRKELLDLGLRNPLINHRPKAKQIKIIDEKSVELFRILAIENKKMSFLALKEGDIRIEDPVAFEEEQTKLMLTYEDVNSNGGVAKRHTDNKLQTALNEQGLQKKLLTIHRDAKSYIEEQGVNILFLALGFLYWYESDSSDEPRRAPLILIPVEFKRTDIKERFYVEYSGADLSYNLSLYEKLKVEFGLKLPEIDNLDDFDIVKYCNEVSQVTEKFSKWKVEMDEITLGFFSFGKFLMYADLDIENWSAEINPDSSNLMNALLTDGFDSNPSIYPEDSQIDKVVRPDDLHLVMDADSSQILSILDVIDGRNLVIQGPPGTGKSQTIANIIAESIGLGKTVLFVSEKMAALDVVKRRLDQVHLGDCALELHSFKSNKKNFLAEINRTLNLGKPNIFSKDGDYKLLNSYIEKLNSYAAAVNKPIGNTLVNFINAIGKSQLIKLSISDPKVFEFKNMEEWGDEKFRKYRLIIEKLDNHLKLIGNPVEHTFYGSELEDFLPSEKREVTNLILECIDSLSKLNEIIDTIVRRTDIPHVKKLSKVIQLVNTLRVLENAPKEIQDFNTLSIEWEQDIVPLFDSKVYLQKLDDQYKDQWKYEELLKVDLSGLYDRYLNVKDKWWKFLLPDFYTLKGEFLKYRNSEKLPKNKEIIVEMLVSFIEGQKCLSKLAKFSDTIKSLFNNNLDLEKIDWIAYSKSAQWFKSQMERVEAGSVHKELSSLLTRLDEINVKNSFINELDKIFETYQRLLNDVIKKLKIVSSDKVNHISALNLEEQNEKLNNWKNNIDYLSDWVSFNHILSELKREGLEFIVNSVNIWPFESGYLKSSFDYSWYYGLAEKAFIEFPDIKKFNKSDHDLARTKFIDLDKELLVYNQFKLASKHFDNIPNLNNGAGQLRIIKSQIHKKRRHMPIRELIKQSGQVLQQIKPVFMMSPMSIATYIPPGSINFDLIIFDEASQVKPVDAFGALLRGNQGVVVGDDKQLPPTSFFDSLIAEDDVEDYDSLGDLESILSLFLAKGSNEKMLRWHYRSRHDSLIAVSNNEFYDNKLFIFPSSGNNPIAGGLSLMHLPETSYDRGKTRTNPLEALEVAKAVLQHAKETPDLSLGVVAFSVAQRDAILFHVENLRQENKENELFFSETINESELRKEPFFVKNLENVQGDERDVIFISIGYGKTSEGYFPMSFGPLNRDGGERRLNVLISRARLTMKVFSNFKASDIDIERTQSRGVIALKSFLAYADTGIIEQPYQTGKEPDSPFEEAVLKLLYVFKLIWTFPKRVFC